MNEVYNRFVDIMTAAGKDAMSFEAFATSGFISKFLDFERLTTIIGAPQNAKSLSVYLEVATKGGTETLLARYEKALNKKVSVPAYKKAPKAPKAPKKISVPKQKAPQKSSGGYRSGLLPPAEGFRIIYIDGVAYYERL